MRLKKQRNLQSYMYLDSLYCVSFMSACRGPCLEVYFHFGKSMRGLRSSATSDPSPLTPFFIARLDKTPPRPFHLYMTLFREFNDDATPRRGDVQRVVT
jgi:hypothetical protein